MTRCIDALKEWPGKQTATLIYDSTVDEYTDGALFHAVMNKPHIALIAFTTDGDVFGGFYSVAVTEANTKFFDPDIFLFSFESHGRCATPQRFVVQDDIRSAMSVMLYTNETSGWFLWFWNDYESGVCLGNERSETWCYELSSGFVGIEDDTLTGNSEYPDLHRCCRIIAVHMT